MGLILAPEELRTQINLMREYMNDNVACYMNAKESIQQYVSDEQLISESWEASKEKMNICYAAIIAGALAAIDSTNSDLNILESSIGNEYLNQDLIEELIKSYEEQCKTLEGLIEEAKSGQNNLEELCGGNSWQKVAGVVFGLGAEIARMKIQMEVLQAKLDFLDHVNETTADLFESAISMLSTVTTAIRDGRCVIAGMELSSNIDWKTEIIGFDNGIIDRMLDQCLESELGITLNEFKNLYGGNAVTQMREYVISGAICIREDMNPQAVVAKFLSAASGGCVLAVNGRYKFKDKESNQTVRYTPKEISELLKNNSGFLERIGEAEVYAAVVQGRAGLSDEVKEANAEYIYNYLSLAGWSREAICGVLGNFDTECGLNPGAWQIMDNPTKAYGLAQWSPASDFFKEIGMEKDENGEVWKKADNMVANSTQELMDIELQYFLDSCDPDNPNVEYRWSKGYMDTPFYMRSASEYSVSHENPADLATVFRTYYERSSADDLESRKDNAEKWSSYFQ